MQLTRTAAVEKQTVESEVQQIDPLVNIMSSSQIIDIGADETFFCRDYNAQYETWGRP